MVSVWYFTEIAVTQTSTGTAKAATAASRATSGRRRSRTDGHSTTARTARAAKNPTDFARYVNASSSPATTPARTLGIRSMRCTAKSAVANTTPLRMSGVISEMAGMEAARPTPRANAASVHRPRREVARRSPIRSTPRASTVPASNTISR